MNLKAAYVWIGSAALALALVSPLDWIARKVLLMPLAVRAEQEQKMHKNGFVRAEDNVAIASLISTSKTVYAALLFFAFTSVCFFFVWNTGAHWQSAAASSWIGGSILRWSFLKLVPALDTFSNRSPLDIPILRVNLPSPYLYAATSALGALLGAFLASRSGVQSFQLIKNGKGTSSA